ncbi:DEAD/DEAH box helicase [Aeromicrobium duanguangcaii]|uniref:RNA helicase n=1 Tax=Aeromicrobium duanguangcaii TaxID=2968086 RepID=A0ABY5KDI1_9ACTN|nr:DEAD/DEAH box helicase [Aeromicrobium duanguangcaii]MCD9154732.1 DEAD/DEAH box helicase [Aeromicrobium duanguangcaii]UUI67854.1 DEAD/DEAH box helicase [Aeromicrobium duanguangcaii]
MPEIVDALTDKGIIEAFPIQEMTLSVALMGTDLIGQARTGTGKTLAFAIPVIQRTVAPNDPDFDQLAAPGKPQALIVAPTRELAIQVAGDVATASKNRGTRNLTIYGGVPYEPQLEALESGVDIVVGTPGRILDLVNRGALDISHVKSLVLDEADEMLDLGFLPDVESILARTPETRQTMLFSATMPSSIVTLARKHMHHPMNIRAESAESGQTVPATSQFVWQAHDMDKPEVVARILQADDVERVVIFTRTKRQAQRVADDLADRGFPASPLHGDMAQKAREKALDGFREGKVSILVATDVAARGIDVANISHVINYTCPEDDKTYVHRIGRTGRAGATGIAVTFVDWADLQRWKLINKALDLPYDEPIETYSTSDHLFQDMGIDRNVKGRLKPPAPKEPRSEGGRDGQKRDGRSGGHDRDHSRDGGSRPAAGSTEKQTERRPQAASDEQVSGEGQARRRRRRRTRGGKPAEGAPQAAAD